MVSLHPNALLPCGTDSARRRHLAKAELCVICEPELQRRAVCPSCGQRVAVLGVFFEVHDVDDLGVECRKSGRYAGLPKGRVA